MQLARERQSGKGFFPCGASLLRIAALGLAASATLGSTPEQEKAFTDKYKTAYEAKDVATLYSLLYIENANPIALGFYKMMMGGSAGHKIATIELVDLSPEEAREAAAVQEGQGGIKTRLPLKSTKKLRIKVEIKRATTVLRRRTKRSWPRRTANCSSRCRST